MFLYYSVKHIWNFKMFFFLTMLKVCVAFFSLFASVYFRLWWGKLKLHHDIFSAYMQWDFFSLSNCICWKTNIKQNNNKNKNSFSMNMHCHKSSILAPVCRGQLWKRHQNHPAIHFTCSQGPGGEASIITRCCLIIMSTNSLSSTITWACGCFQPAQPEATVVKPSCTSILF